jgi:2-keto-4-pentenoate hydratase/2-oxohepta-3-ene-1,7-dioic acid hydratase in catechol pathway
MRFVNFLKDGLSGLALETDSGLVGLLSDHPDYPGSLDDIVRGGSFQAAAERLLNGAKIQADGIEYQPPFARAGKILCIGLNYDDHVTESAMAKPTAPTVFARFNTGLIGHGAALVKPGVSDKFDYEAEVVAVIGKKGRAIPEADALDHVAGYSIFNDGSIRDFQLQTTQWGVGKNFDGTGAFGPVFVTADELPAGAAGLHIETRLNGSVMQSANTDDLIFDVRKLVAFLSVAMTLEPGDLIVTGTPSGVGAARNPQVFMMPGDVCEISVESIGVLRNPVRAEHG